MNICSVRRVIGRAAAASSRTVRFYCDSSACSMIGSPRHPTGRTGTHQLNQNEPARSFNGQTTVNRTLFVKLTGQDIRMQLAIKARSFLLV